MLAISTTIYQGNLFLKTSHGKRSNYIPVYAESKNIPKHQHWDTFPSPLLLHKIVLLRHNQQTVTDKRLRFHLYLLLISGWMSRVYASSKLSWIRRVTWPLAFWCTMFFLTWYSRSSFTRCGTFTFTVRTFRSSPLFMAITFKDKWDPCRKNSNQRTIRRFCLDHWYAALVACACERELREGTSLMWLDVFRRHVEVEVIFEFLDVERFAFLGGTPSRSSSSCYSFASSSSGFLCLLLLLGVGRARLYALQFQHRSVCAVDQNNNQHSTWKSRKKLDNQSAFLFLLWRVNLTWCTVFMLQRHVKTTLWLLWYYCKNLLAYLSVLRGRPYLLQWCPRWCPWRLSAPLLLSSDLRVQHHAHHCPCREEYQQICWKCCRFTTFWDTICGDNSKVTPGTSRWRRCQRQDTKPVATAGFHSLKKTRLSKSQECQR